MHEYSFKNSQLCIRQPQLPKQSHAFQHLLPPDSTLSKHSKQKQNYKIQDALIRKNQQLQILSEKNNQLIMIINQKQIEKTKLNKKYGELLEMYEEMRNQFGATSRIVEIQALSQENRILVEKVRKLQRELIQSEKEIIRKAKFYEDKNQDSRKLLEKLNQNLTKRQQKFKLQLQQTQTELRKKTTALTKLQQQYRYLQNLHSQKQDQLTKILQETQRDRSAFSQNISTIEMKLQTENSRLNQEIIGLNQTIDSLKRQTSIKIRDLSERNQDLYRENQRMRMEVQESREGLEGYNGRLLSMEIGYKELEGKYRVMEVQNQQNMSKLELKRNQLTQQKEKAKQLEEIRQNLEKQVQALKKQCQKLQISQNQLSEDLQTSKVKIQTGKKILEQKISQLADAQIQVQEQKQMNQKYAHDMEQLDRYNEELKTNLKTATKKVSKLEELLQTYKSEKIRVRQENENKWKQMTQFYESQIQKLQSRVLGLQSKSTTNLKASPTKSANFLQNQYYS